MSQTDSPAPPSFAARLLLVAAPRLRRRGAGPESPLQPRLRRARRTYRLDDTDGELRPRRRLRQLHLLRRDRRDLRLSGGGDQNFWITSDQCIPVDPGATPELLLAGMYRTTADVFARIYLQYFSDGACLAPIGFSTTVFGGTSAGWNRIAGVVDTRPRRRLGHRFRRHHSGHERRAGSSRCSGIAFYLGVEPQIFRDDFEFESGSACHWSAVVGGI
ncbi:MAG: hypothetical protein V9F00_13090 [Nocardioides sp.]